MGKADKIITMIIGPSEIIYRRFRAFNLFVEYFDDIQIFFQEMGENDLKLNDKQWF